MGCSCRDGGTSSDELATNVLPGLNFPVSGLKAPLSLASGLLMGPPPPNANHRSLLVAVIVLKPMLHWLHGREKTNHRKEEQVVWFTHCLMLGPCPSPEPRATWGRTGWCQAFKVKLFLMAR